MEKTQLHIKGGITIQHSFKAQKVTVLGEEQLLFLFDDGSKILSDLLSSDIGNNPTFVYRCIDKVLSGESERERIFGNVCYLDITKNTTEVRDNLLEPDEITDEDCCEISTLELRGLIGFWIEENRKLHQKDLIT